MKQLKCSECNTAVVWEDSPSGRGTMVCACTSTRWVIGEGMKPWEPGYEDSLVLVEARVIKHE